MCVNWRHRISRFADTLRFTWFQRSMRDSSRSTFGWYVNGLKLAIYGTPTMCLINSYDFTDLPDMSFRLSSIRSLYHDSCRDITSCVVRRLRVACDVYRDIDRVLTYCQIVPRLKLR
jgi:hypothetical protein